MIRCERVIVERSGQMVIDRLSLEIGTGETLAVIGRSGAGKTTLLESLATAIAVRGGDIAVDGHSVRRDPDAVRSRIGYAPSQLAAWPAVRADEFLALFARSAGLGGRGLTEALDRALALAGLSGRGHASIDRLSAGQAKVLLMPVSARRGLNELPCSGSTRTKDHILSTIKKSDGVTLDLDHIVKRNSCSLIGQGR